MHAAVSLLPLLLLPTLRLQSQQSVVRGDEGRRLDSLVRAAEAEGFHGNVLVLRRGEPILQGGYGLANHATGVRFTPATVVPIGSNVKDFTATAIYQLVEGGRLRVTDSLYRFFDDLPHDKRVITLRQLLEHRAGLPPGVAPDDEPLTKEEMLRRFRELQLSAPPGAREEYSNLGYSLLAAVIERVGGKSFEAYVAEHLFAPAGMKQTGLALPAFDPSQVAHGYAGGEDRGTMLDLPRDADGHLWSLRGNGGMLSTLADMHRFYRALRGPLLLRSAEHRRAAVPLDEPGVWAGSDRVSFFAYASFPKEEVEILLASNHRESPGQRLLRRLQVAVGMPAPEDRGAVLATGPLLDRIPDTGIGRTVAAFVEAYNSGDTAVMRRFFTDHAEPRPDAPPMETRLARYRQMRHDLGRLTVRGAQHAPDGEGMVLAATGETGEAVRLTVAVQPEAPYRLRWVRVEVGS
jgi:CubicO group peptidase (beta-lactamase class C family)